VLTLAVIVTIELGYTSTNVFPAPSSVVYVLASAPAPVPVCPLLLAPGPVMGSTEPVMEAAEEVGLVVVDVTALEIEGVTVTVWTVTIGLRAEGLGSLWWVRGGGGEGGGDEHDGLSGF